MKKYQAIFIALLLTLHFSISIAADGIYTDSYRYTFEKGNPNDFLRFLKHQDTQKTYVTEGQTKGFVKRKHIPDLIKKLNSKEKCMAVSLPESSSIRLGSTIGDEAAFLIAGYRKGVYPPELNSTPLEAAEKAEILEWWRREKGQKP